MSETPIGKCVLPALKPNFAEKYLAFCGTFLIIGKPQNCCINISVGTSKKSSIVANLCSHHIFCYGKFAEKCLISYCTIFWKIIHIQLTDYKSRYFVHN